MVDLTVAIGSGAWHYDPPYFAPEVWSLDSPDWVPGVLYAEAIRAPLQSGTYIESAAHCYPDAMKISAYPLSRTVLLPTLCVDTPAEPGTGITRDAVEKELARLDVAGTMGMGLLINTGWWKRTDPATFTSECPYFEDGVADLVIEGGFSLIGSDTPRFEDPGQPSGHIRRMFDRDVLLLSPLTNLGAVGTASGRLIVAPLAIDGVAATFTRAIWLR